MEKGYSDKDYVPEYKGPSWSTQRSNFWKNEARKPGALEKWGIDNIDKMSEGKAPTKNSQKIDLHHPHGRKGNNIENFYPLPQNEHRDFHKQNGYRYDPKIGWH